MPDLTPYGPWAMVLGASEGLGRAWAHGLAAQGANVVLVARGLPKLEAVAEELHAEHGVQTRVLSLDLGRPDVGTALLEATADLDVGLAVYNACYSAIAPFRELTPEQIRTTLAVNAQGPALVAHALAPRLAARDHAALVLMSSMSGFQGSAMVGVYAATKAFDTVLGEMLWEELGRDGVDVLVCVAGATLTPNFEDATPEGRRAGARPMTPDDVVAEALDALARRAGPTFVAGTFNRWVTRLFGLLPRRTAVRFISDQTRKMYRPEHR